MGGCKTPPDRVVKRHRLIVRSRAERDLVAAIAEYESIAPGLGAAFLSRTDAALAAIQRAPEACRKSHGEYRHLVLRRYPFGIFYLFDGETVAVAAVLPLRQDPASIRASLD